MMPFVRHCHGHVDLDTEPQNSHTPRQRKIIHVDMDAFYASVEQRDDPSLRGRPVVVGGAPNSRGVVAACSYEARAYGVHSAMPSAEAGRRCPHAVFVKPRFETYRQVSADVHAVFRELTDQIEPLSLDEAYLDVSEVTGFDGSAVRMAREIRARILGRTGLVASAGVSFNKFLAKLASDFDKPDGLFCVLPTEAEAFVAKLPIGRFHGIGRVTEARMQALGIYTGADLRAFPLPELEAEFGSSAGTYYRLARAIDDRPVKVHRVRKSIGNERTFSRNLADRDQMLQHLLTLAEGLLVDLDQKGLLAQTLTAKVRFADFKTYTRAWSAGPGQVQTRARARRALPWLLDRALSGRTAPQVRLLGVSFSGLRGKDDMPPQQLDLDGL